MERDYHLEAGVLRIHNKEKEKALDMSAHGRYLQLVEIYLQLLISFENSYNNVKVKSRTFDSQTHSCLFASLLISHLCILVLACLLLFSAVAHILGLGIFLDTFHLIDTHRVEFFQIGKTRSEEKKEFCWRCRNYESESDDDHVILKIKTCEL